jgi:hypothetical protein
LATRQLHLDVAASPFTDLLRTIGRIERDTQTVQTGVNGPSGNQHAAVNRDRDWPGDLSARPAPTLDHLYARSFEPKRNWHRRETKQTPGRAPADAK